MFTALPKYSGSSCSKSMARVELQETQDYIQTGHQGLVKIEIQVLFPGIHMEIQGS